MSVYSELPTVIEIIKRKTDSVVDSATKDFVFERILSTSPITEQITASTSLESEEVDFYKQQQAESIAFKGGTGQPNSAGASGSSGAVDQRAAKTITFKADEPTKFVFAKEKIETPAGVSSFPDFRPRKGEVVTVFLYGNSLPPQKPLKVTIEKTATVEELIRVALKTYTTEQRQPPLPTSGIQLRTAEDDGSPDMVELNLRSPIGKLGRTFALLIGEHVVLPKNRSETSNFSSLTRDNNSIGGSGSSGGSGGGGSGTLVVIHLPNMEKTTVQLPQELQMRLLLNRICAKRGLHPTDYHFKLVGSNSPVKLDLTLHDLAVTEIRLCHNKS